MRLLHGGCRPSRRLTPTTRDAGSYSLSGVHAKAAAAAAVTAVAAVAAAAAAAAVAAAAWRAAWAAADAPLGVVAVRSQSSL